MSSAQVRRMPIVDPSDRICGIVSLGDLSREADPQAADQALQGVSAPGAASTARVSGYRSPLMVLSTRAASAFRVDLLGNQPGGRAGGDIGGMSAKLLYCSALFRRDLLFRHPPAALDQSVGILAGLLDHRVSL